MADAKIQIRLPMPLDIPDQLLAMMGARWPGAYLSPEARDYLTIVIPDECRFAPADPEAIAAAAEAERPERLPVPTTAETQGLLNEFSNEGIAISGGAWLAMLQIGIARAMLEAYPDANYIESDVTDMDTHEVFPFMVGRPGRPSVHTLRRQAEAEVETLKARVAELEAELAAR